MFPARNLSVHHLHALSPAAAAAAVTVFVLALLATRGATALMLPPELAVDDTTVKPETPACWPSGACGPQPDEGSADAGGDDDRDGGVGGDRDVGGGSARAATHAGGFACNVAPLDDDGGDESHDVLLWAILCALGICAIPRHTSTER